MKHGRGSHRGAPAAPGPALRTRRKRESRPRRSGASERAVFLDPTPGRKWLREVPSVLCPHAIVNLVDRTVSIDHGNAIARHVLRQILVEHRQRGLDFALIVQLCSVASSHPSLASHLRRDIENDGQIRATGVTIERSNPLERPIRVHSAGDALVREARRVVAIRQHNAAGREERLDLTLDVIHPIGGEQERHRDPRGRSATGSDDPSRQDLSDEHPDRTAAGFVCRMHPNTRIAQAVGEYSNVGCRPRAIDAFEHDESSPVPDHRFTRRSSG